MNNLNIGKNIKNDDGSMLNQFKTALKFRLDDNIKYRV